MVKFLRNKKGQFAGSVKTNKAPTVNMVPKKVTIFRDKKFSPGGVELGENRETQSRIFAQLIEEVPWVENIYYEDDPHFDLFLNLYGRQIYQKQDFEKIKIYRKARDSKHLSRFIDTYAGSVHSTLFKEPETILGMLMNKRLTGEDLDKLQYPMLRAHSRWDAFLAAHPKASNKVLHDVVREGSRAALNVLAQRPDISDEIALALSQNDLTSSKKLLATNPNVSDEIKTIAALTF